VPQFTWYELQGRGLCKQYYIRDTVTQGSWTQLGELWGRNLGRGKAKADSRISRVPKILLFIEHVCNLCGAY
jgi:hypothetical protein